jgi:endonuclease IV
VTEKLGLKARENDVWISLHGSYFINFCGTKDKIEASKNRLIACATAAEWMNANVVVFHPGFYGKRQSKKVFKDCLEALKDAVETMHCHFTKVEFTEKGERRHHTMGEVEYGPDFAMLAKVIAEFKLKPVVISESPVLDVDSIKMRDILQEELKN